jgi:hypothetical protein
LFRSGRRRDHDESQVIQAEPYEQRDKSTGATIKLEDVAE